MPNFNKFFAILISLQTIIFTTMLPVFIALPLKDKLFKIFEIPITWQIPSIILLSIVFTKEVVIKSFSIYLLLGLFFIPVFHQGGSLGYINTPNFGYLIGIFFLIYFINNNKNKYGYSSLTEFIKSGILGITSMHIVGIFYSIILFLCFRNIDLLYTISKLSFGKFGYHLLMLTPITLFIKAIYKINRKILKE